MPDSGDVALACASLLVDEFVRGGVRHACLTPGSRSTPLALAVARHPGLTLHVHVDERASAFYALGIARASGAPSLALCSSGTAAANHLPAVVEASMSCLPLIVLTADRPPELRDTGANQTIDQQRLFGSFARWFVDPGVPVEDRGAAKHWRSLGARAVARSLAQPPGPVHINLPFREPLVPAGAEVVFGGASAGRPDGRPWHATVTPPRMPAEADARALSPLLETARRVAVVAGTTRRPAPVWARFAGERGWPVLAEPTSNMRRPGVALAAAELLVADAEFRTTQRADLVVQIGAAPTTRAMQRFVAEDAVEPDPGRDAVVTLRGEPDGVAAALSPLLDAAPFDEEWRRQWARADAAVRSAVDDLLDSWDEPFEGRVARDVCRAAPARATLFAGSSMPVRDLATYMPPLDALRVLANRGASGIDGSVASTLGIAAVAQPVLALIGDLALLHDASALLWSAAAACSAVLVVVDNDGGGIFSLLPQASLEGNEFERLFGTPHGPAVDLRSLAAAAAAGYARVTTAGDLLPALSGAQEAGGVQMVHVVVDRGRAPVLRAAVARSVRETLERLSPVPARAASRRT
jgi:2-succinyl-5-enolpyruvyl-6-hydroxy-3-cyclohexene-1-carboxylate synthase